MSQNRAQIDAGANNVRQQQAGEIVLSQMKITPLTTVGAGAISATAVLSGAIRRTGPVAGFTDTWPSAAAILAAAPVLSVGDSFELVYQNGVAFAMTAAAGSGIVLGINPDTAASAVRRYLFTVLGAGQGQVFQATTTNTSAAVSGLTPAQAALITPGMGVTGTGVPGNTTVIGVNSTTGVVTLSANATADGTVGLTFFPRIQVDGLYSATA